MIHAFIGKLAPTVMKILFMFMAVAILATLGARADVSVSLVQATLSADGTIAVRLLAANTSAAPIAYAFASEFDGRVAAGTQSWPLHLTTASQGGVTIAPGSFVARAYTGRLPAVAPGELILEANQGLPSAVAAIIQRQPLVAAADGPADVQPSAPPLPPAKTAASLIQRTFADRIAAHEPIYFIYGTHAPGAKFQFSFKYELLHIGQSSPTYVPDTVQFAYTQRSLWDITGNSSPFYDTSYMPEIIFESLTAAPKKSDSSWFTYLGYQTAARHESNGKEGDSSRSMNTVYFRPVVAFGPLDNWHLILIPEIFDYIGGVSDNRDIANYRGYGQLRAVLGNNSGPSLLFTGIPGKGFHKHTLQWDLTIPVHIPIIDFETYFLTQYFDGYGESLLHYNQKSRVVRFGFSLVR